MINSNNMMRVQKKGERERERERKRKRNGRIDVER